MVVRLDCEEGGGERGEREERESGEALLEGGGRVPGFLYW